MQDSFQFYWKKGRKSQELRMVSGIECGGDPEKTVYAWDSATVWRSVSYRCLVILSTTHAI